MAFELPDSARIIASPNVGVMQLDKALTRYAAHIGPEQRYTLVGIINTASQLSRISNVCILALITKETRYFTSTRWTDNYNAGGIGATGDNVEGNKFANASEGIFATVAHLLHYAAKPTTFNLAQRSVAMHDPRAKEINQTHGYGSAPLWVDLWQKWGYIADAAKVPSKLDRSAYGMSIVIRARTLATL